MLVRMLFLCLLCHAISGCIPGGGIVPLTEQVTVPRVTPLQANSISRTSIFDRIVFDIPRGTIIGEARRGTLCVFAEPHKWNAEVVALREGRYHSEFDRILTQYNFPVPAKPASLFESSKIRGDELIVAARVTKLQENFCGAVNVWAGNQPILKGNARFSIIWEVYSLYDEKVLVTFESEGSAVQSEFLTWAESTYFVEAFGNALKGLLENPEFRKVVLSIPKPKGEL